jgi:hypothetical protein
VVSWKHSIVAENRCPVRVYTVMFDSKRFEAIVVGTCLEVPRSRDPWRVRRAMEKRYTTKERCGG